MDRITQQAITQADGYAADDAPLASHDLAVSVCPGPFSVRNTFIVDAVGRAMASAATFNLAGTTEFALSIARRNAIRVCQALNAEDNRKQAVVASKLSARDHARYQIAKAIDAAYGGAPITDDGTAFRCALCLAHGGSSVYAIAHNDDCPIYDLSDALAGERDGRGWTEVQP